MTDAHPPPATPGDLARNALLKRRATAVSLAVAVTILCVKIATWLASASVSVLSVLIDSVLDIAIGVVNVMAVRQAQKPADRYFRFGFSKVEPLASLAQSTFMAGAGVMIALEAAHRLLEPHAVEHTGWAILAMLLISAITLGLVAYQRYVIRVTAALIVRADTIHYRSDLLLYLSVMVALLFSGMPEFGWVDSVTALAVAAYLVWSARSTFVEAIYILLDRELPVSDRHRIRDIVLSNPAVCGVHDLRTRSSGDKQFIQLHVEMDGDLSLNAAHQHTDDMIAAILAIFPNAEVQIHEEPRGTARDDSWCRKAGLSPPSFPGQYGE